MKNRASDYETVRKSGLHRRRIGQTNSGFPIVPFFKALCLRDKALFLWSDAFETILPEFNSFSCLNVTFIGECLSRMKKIEHSCNYIIQTNRIILWVYHKSWDWVWTQLNSFTSLDNVINLNILLAPNSLSSLHWEQKHCLELVLERDTTLTDRINHVFSG